MKCSVHSCISTKQFIVQYNCIPVYGSVRIYAEYFRAMDCELLRSMMYDVLFCTVEPCACDVIRHTRVSSAVISKHTRESFL